MVDIVGQVLVKLTDYLSENDLKADSAFKIPFAESVAGLIRENKLTLANLEKTVQGNNPFFLVNGISRRQFAEGVYPYLKEITTIAKSELKGLFDDFFTKLYYQLPRDHYRLIWNKGRQREDITRGFVFNSIVWFCQGHGIYAYKEIPSGRGFVDILIAKKVEIVVEVKNSGNFDPNVGIKQLVDYINDRPRLRRGYYILFDFTKGYKFSDLCDLRNSRFTYVRNPKMLVIQCYRVQPSTQKY
ncbi:hypothetical protein KAX06_05925 [candidate division WOR-3 bacterium]|nr:hypothetical protein [candidate division WOR-3 bacterium]